ncbi:MAG: sulfotransferase domain-containing protein [Bacillota bacterium]
MTGRGKEKAKIKDSLPSFIIIGVQKGGTTSLYEYITKHPNVKPATTKEVHFFDYNFHKGINWYKSHFPTNLKKGVLTGEASPYYIFHPYSPLRIKEVIPDIKLIVLLRNPVYRAYSAYKMGFRRGIEKLTFEEAIAKEESRLKNDIINILKNPYYYGFNHQHFSYLSRGIYVDQLTKWFEFFDRRKFLILQSESFLTNPAANYRQVIRFLGLPDWEPEHYRVFNKGNYNQDIQTKTLYDLNQFFKPHNQRLYDLLGTDFGWEQEFKC